jgi:hypothetical protein
VASTRDQASSNSIRAGAFRFSLAPAKSPPPSHSSAPSSSPLLVSRSFLPGRPVATADIATNTASYSGRWLALCVGRSWVSSVVCCDICANCCVTVSAVCSMWFLHRGCFGVSSAYCSSPLFWKGPLPRYWIKQQLLWGSGKCWISLFFDWNMCFCLWKCCASHVLDLLLVIIVPHLYHYVSRSWMILTTCSCCFMLCLVFIYAV